MSKSPRGTTGAAPSPPANLHTTPLPIKEIAAGGLLYRVHPTAYGPIFYGPGPDNPPNFRFDPESGRFGVLYIAPHPDAALIETLLRQPRRSTVEYRQIADRSLTTMTASRTLRLVSATGSSLSRLGTTAALSTGPYEPCAQWADALYDHPDAPDGILFSSRHNPDELCIALFEKLDIDMTVVETVPLTSLLKQVGEILDRHGKSLFGSP